MAKPKKRSTSIIDCFYGNRKEFEKAWKRLEKEQVDLLDMFDSLKEKARTKETIYRFIHEELFVKYGIKLTDKQVQNRILYLQKKAQKEFDKQFERKPRTRTITTEEIVDTMMDDQKEDKSEQENKPTLIQDTSPKFHHIDYFPYYTFSDHLVNRKEESLNLNDFTYGMISSEKFVEAVNKLCKTYNCRHYLHGDNKLTPIRVVDELAIFFGVRRGTLRSRYYATQKKMRTKANDELVQKKCIKTMQQVQQEKIEELEQKLIEKENQYLAALQESQSQRKELDRIVGIVDDLEIRYSSMTNKPIMKFITDRFYDLITLKFPILKRYWRREKCK